MAMKWATENSPLPRLNPKSPGGLKAVGLEEEAKDSGTGERADAAASDVTDEVAVEDAGVDFPEEVQGESLYKVR